MHPKFEKADEYSSQAIGAAIEVHRELGGPGLLEEIYESAMVYELRLRGLAVEQQVAIPVLYKGHNIKKPHYLDLLIEDRVVNGLSPKDDLRASVSPC